MLVALQVRNTLDLRLKNERFTSFELLPEGSPHHLPGAWAGVPESGKSVEPDAITVD